MTNNTANPNDDVFYVQAYQEIESETPHIATWAKALAESGGNKPQAKSMYLQLRVEALKAEATAAPATQITKYIPTEKRKLNQKWLATVLITLPLIAAGIYFAGSNTNSPNEARQVVDGYEISPSGDEVLDPKTNLVWKRCSLGQTWDAEQITCTGISDKYSFKDAQLVAEELNQTGHAEVQPAWRVPTIQELATIRYCTNGFKGEQNMPDGQASMPDKCAGGNFEQPTISHKVFPATVEGRYWSSTVGDVLMSWGVRFNKGDTYVTNAEERNHVRLVRNSNVERATQQPASTQPRVEPSPKTVEPINAIQPQQPTQEQSQQPDKADRLGQVNGLNPKGDGFLAVRTQPDSNASELAKLYEGDRFRILQEKNDWVEVELPNKNLRGWSHKKWISLNPNATKDKATDWPYGLPVKMEEEDGWRAQINLTCLDVDKACATIDYKALNCGGGLIYKGNQNNFYNFEQVLLYGNCVKGCQVALDASKKTYIERCPTGTTSESGTLFIESY